MLVKAENIIVRTADFQLGEINFSLEDGKILAVTGKNASGKTLLLETLANKHFIFSGKLTGITLEQTAFIPQQHRFRDQENLHDFFYQQRFNSSFAGESETVSEKIRNETSRDLKELNQILHLLKIDHLIDKEIIKLSNGENKRLQLAIALAKSPRLIILDMPFTGLDLEAQQTLEQVFLSLREKSVSIIYSCKEDEINNVADELLILDHGKQIFLAEPKQYSLNQNANQSLRISLPKFNNSSTNNNEIIEFKNVNIKYSNKQILKDINWKVLEGEKWLLSGANGAGKSTILSLITADNPQAYANDIKLFGKIRGSGESIWDIKKQIGFLSPEFHLYFDENATCFQAIASGFYDTTGYIKKLDQSQIESVNSWLNALNLINYAEYKISQLSLGLQRLILIARALIKQPRLLILDEPCQGLDYQHTELVKDFIQQLPDSCTIIYVSHNKSDIPAALNMHLALDQGMIKYCGKRN